MPEKPARPVYSLFDEGKSFDGNIEAGYYYIKTDNFFPFKGAGWYDADLVFYAVKCKIIKRVIYYSHSKPAQF